MLCKARVFVALRRFVDEIKVFSKLGQLSSMLEEAENSYVEVLNKERAKLIRGTRRSIATATVNFSSLPKPAAAPAAPKPNDEDVAEAEAAGGSEVSAVDEDDPIADSRGAIGEAQWVDDGDGPDKRNSNEGR